MIKITRKGVCGVCGEVYKTDSSLMGLNLTICPKCRKDMHDKAWNVVYDRDNDSGKLPKNSIAYVASLLNLHFPNSTN